MRRVAVPDDVAGAAVWLASDASALVTGQDLAVDGGLSVGPPASVQAEARAGLAQVLADTAGYPDNRQDNQCQYRARTGPDDPIP